MNKPIDLIYVGWLPPHRSGAAVFCLQLLRAFANNGYRVRALAPVKAGMQDLAPAAVTAARPVALRHFTTGDDSDDLNAPGSVDYRRQLTEKPARLLAQCIGEARPDIIVIGSENFFTANVDVATAHGIPCALMNHGKITAFLSPDFPVPLRNQALERLRQADVVFACAAHLAARMAGFGIKDTIVVPNAVDARAFRPRPKNPDLLAHLDIRPDDAVVLHASNLRPVKRAADIVASAATVLRQRPDVVYLVVGTGKHRDSLQQACAADGIDRQFRFVPWVEHADMPDFFALADLVVMPSQGEGLALAYLEAQAAARVVLASDIPAAREVIADGGTGLLFPMGDVAALAAKTLAILDDPARRQRIGEAARDYVVAHHPLDRAIDAYDQALRALLR